MGQTTKIQWCHHTFNHVRGCTKISPGCANCYAEKLSNRNPAVLGEWGPSGKRIVASESMWKEPLKWDRAAQQAGDRRRVFCASLADVFEDWQGVIHDSSGDVMFVELGQWVKQSHVTDPNSARLLTLTDVRRRLFKLVQRTPNLDWLILTKRPENIYRLTHAAIDTFDDPAFDYNAAGEPNGLEVAEFGELYPNVWLGTSVENQRYANERIPRVVAEYAAVCFLSCEPLLEEVDLRPFLRGENRVNWVIVGGESGPDARSCDVEHVRSIIRQCQEASVPVFVKQLGSQPSTRLPDFERWPGHTLPPDQVNFVGNGFGDYLVEGLRDSKGGDPLEWPEDLRVQQFPEVKV